MIVIPQADLLNMLPVTQVAPLAARALEGGVSPRFDAALLEAAKLMRDSAPQEPSLTLVPKVQQAFEGVLSELSQKPLDQLKTLVASPQAARPEINVVIARVAQAAGLNAEERSVLMDLVPLALPRLLDYKAQTLIPGTPATNMTLGGEQPGPQGGPPVREASPVETDLNLQPGLTDQPLEPHALGDVNAASRDTADSAGAGFLLAQLPSAPVIVSTRTDDGSSKSSALSQTSTVSSNNSTGPVQPPTAAPAPLAPQGSQGAPVLVPVAPEHVAPQGRVIQVSVSPQVESGIKPVPAPQPIAPVAPNTPTGSVQSAVPQGPRALNVPQAQPGSDSALHAAFAQAKVGDAPALTSQSVGPEAEPQAPATQPSGAPKALLPSTPNASTPVIGADLDFQFQDPTRPLAVVPGSELTLQEDGTWTQPVPAQTGKPTTTAPQGGVAQAPALVTGAGTPTASSSVVPPTTAKTATDDLQPSTENKPTLADAFQAPDRTPALRREAADNAFSGFGQAGQDPLRALAQQTAREHAVRESVFKQVYQALREAPETESGRMLIRLNPAELGEVHIDLVLANGKLSARLVASQAEVRDAFVRDLPGLKAGLESQGLAVRDISVAVRAGIADQQQQAPQQQPDPQAWWRELPRQEPAPGLGAPASAGYSHLSVTDQRFSALA